MPQRQAKLADPGRHVIRRPKQGRQTIGGEETLPANVQDIAGREEAAHSRQSVAPPFQLIVSLERVSITEIGMDHNLGHRQKEFPCLGRRGGSLLDLVHRRLRGGDAVFGEQQTFAPEQGLASDGNRERDPGRLNRVVHIGVQQFGVAPHQVAHAAGKPAIAAGDGVERRRRVVGAVHVVCGIVPALRRDIEAEAALLA